MAGIAAAAHELRSHEEAGWFRLGMVLFHGPSALVALLAVLIEGYRGPRALATPTVIMPLCVQVALWWLYSALPSGGS